MFKKIQNISEGRFDDNVAMNSRNAMCPAVFSREKWNSKPEEGDLRVESLQTKMRMVEYNHVSQYQDGQKEQLQQYKQQHVGVAANS